MFEERIILKRLEQNKCPLCGGKEWSSAVITGATSCTVLCNICGTALKVKLRLEVESVEVLFDEHNKNLQKLQGMEFNSTDKWNKGMINNIETEYHIMWEIL